MVRLFYFLLGLLLFALISIPQEWADQCRVCVVSAIAPIWQSAAPHRQKEAFDETNSGAEVGAFTSQLVALQELLLDEQRLKAEADSLAAAFKQSDSEKIAKHFGRRTKRLQRLLEFQYSSIPAQVIFREPASWSSTIWISVGEMDNREVEQTIVARNSPVLSNHALIGVIEYVGETQSRVRLISDAGLVCAVRAMRGGVQNREINQQVQNLLTHVQVRNDLFASSDEQIRFVDMLSVFQKRLNDWEEEELAKGEIFGTSVPLFRSRQTTLKGMGFNYDFADEAGPARDLKSGKPIGEPNGQGKVLLQIGDLLATSGYDGIFPAGIPVAIVTAVDPLKEGAFTYELEAKPAAGDLMDLQTVFVMPPLGLSAKSHD